MSDIKDVQNSLNINFTGIHVFDYLFSVKLYEKWDQDEISRTILKILYSRVVNITTAGPDREVWGKRCQPLILQVYI